MKIELGGDKITKEDVIKIAKFFRDWFADRRDVVFLNILEGTEDMSKEEVSLMFKKIFVNSPDYFEVHIPREHASNKL